uniref:Uncharacterized protein n=1 Tax=Kalanchoe fedtschenkoi TaxID=63787 RepID=A0A7N0VLI6_KALFE
MPAAEITCATSSMYQRAAPPSSSSSSTVFALDKQWRNLPARSPSSSSFTQHLRLHTPTRSSTFKPTSQKPIRNQMAKPSTYSSSISTDIPLYESPGASFDEYLEDKPRVFKAIFPDKRRSERLNEEDWRIQMLPIQFLFLTVWPVIDMRLRCKCQGADYPPGVPSEITKVLELDIIKWELLGLDDVLKPSQFSLGVRGALYPDRRGKRSRLKGQLEMNISFVLPPALQLVPQDVLRNVAEAVRPPLHKLYIYSLHPE